MHNCADDVLAHHDEKVTLPTPQQTKMRERRNANRELKKGLKEQGKPAPIQFKSQGSYAMPTMVQHPDNDYDIDDGAYFRKKDLVGDCGAEMSALQARQMVRDAVDDGSFKTPPEVRTNCVRVHYEAGYHVDIPVYRRITTKDVFGNDSHHYELASSDWKRSDARDVTAWFEKENDKQSPDEGNGRQLRRVTRQIKKYARSRESWGSQILSGFGITKLVTECYRANVTREDKAVYDTMKAIRDRLQWNLVVATPSPPATTSPRALTTPRRVTCASASPKPSTTSPRCSTPTARGRKRSSAGTRCSILPSSPSACRRTPRPPPRPPLPRRPCSALGCCRRLLLRRQHRPPFARRAAGGMRESLG